MNKEETIDEIFASAITCRESNELEEAVEKLNRIILVYPDHPKISGVYTVLAGIYESKGDFKKSAKFFRRATLANPDCELASLGLYISLVQLSQYDEAIEELKRFLGAHPTRLYRETLIELREGLVEGYAKEHEDLIQALVAKNNITT